MDLPESFVKRGLELAEGALLFGRPFADMTRDELIAAAAQGWHAERVLREQFAAKVGIEQSVRDAHEQLGKLIIAAERKPLSNERMRSIALSVGVVHGTTSELFARAIEAEHDIK